MIRFLGLTVEGNRISLGRGAKLPAIRLPAFMRRKSYATSPAYSLGGGGWYPLIREGFSGAWQRGITVNANTVLSNVTVFRCIGLISSDCGKMPLRLMQRDTKGIWKEASSPSFSPVITKPNHYQNRIQFIETWLNSKLAAGNTYVLKERDARGVVSQLYILNPRYCRPLVADAGDVYYELMTDYLNGVSEKVIVPATEVIHDRWNCLFHPLVGLSPIFACGLAATQSNIIQEHSAHFFDNGANPGGVLTAPGRINDETAERIREAWQEKFTGKNAGRVAVLGDALKYESMSVNALNSQLIEQLKWTSEMCAGAFGVPAYKVGVGLPPAAITNIEALQQQYYDDCLQIHVESIELCLKEGLNLPDKYAVMFDLDALMRMDTATMVTSIAEAVKAGVMKPNEGRAKLNYAPVAGGDTPYLQQQNFSLAALAKRDAMPDPFGAGKPAPAGSEPLSDVKPNEEVPAAPPPAASTAKPPKKSAEDDADFKMAVYGHAMESL